MPFYENVFIARQDVTAPQVETLAEHFVGILTAQGGQVTKREYWGLKNLSFRIKKNRKGHYMLLNIDAPAAAVQEMERNMHLHEDVLRHLTVRVEALEEGPSAMMRRDREGREGREGRFDRDGGRHRDRDDRPRDDRPRERDDRLRPTRSRDSETSAEGARE